MSRLILNRCNLARLYHTSSSGHTPNGIRERKNTPAVRVASKRYALPELQRSHEAAPRIQESTRKFEPFPYAITEDNKLDVLKRVVTPLHDTPYGEQLASKESLCRQHMRRLGQELYNSGTPVRMDVRRLPCQVNKIVAAKQLYKYRNSDELSIWYGHDGKTLTAGHNVFPLSKHGDTVAVEPNGCVTLRDETIKLCDIIQEFIRTKTKLGACLSIGIEGGWRTFRIVSNQQGDLMLTGILNPRTLKVREVIDDRDLFRDFLVKRCQEEGLNLVSLYYQPCPHSRCRHEDIPYELLHGEKRITEHIGKCKFLISPDYYTMQSTSGAELLLQTVRKTIEDCFLGNNRAQDGVDTSKPLILDARSGFGLFSIALADLADQVIGVEDRSMAVDDARENAKLNGVDNCEFINSNLEIVIERIIEKYCARKHKEMVLVCDMLPGGLHSSVVDVIRHCGYIKKLVLVASKIEAKRIVDSLVDLCRKGMGSSLPPFAPIMATPVDVIPLTDNFFTVLAMERVPH